jgi:hypothetical protein
MNVRSRNVRFAITVGIALGVAVGGCRGGSLLGTAGKGGVAGATGGAGGTVASAGGADGGADAAPFEPLTIESAGNKVKNLMVGQALTDAELTMLQADPKTLRALVDQWMALPAWRARLLGFFEQSFQQTQVTALQYDDQTGLKVNNYSSAALIARAGEESFARTALALIDGKRPFNEVVTTTRFMLNPPLMALIAYMDAVPLDDAGVEIPAASWLTKKYPTTPLQPDTTPGSAMTPIPWEQTIDPTSPNFFKYTYDKVMAAGADPRCFPPPNLKGVRAIGGMADLLFGRFPAACGQTPTVFSADDWDNWRMITVRAAKAGEERTLFWDIAALRAADTLVADTPRVGFMTTPAFFANWMTNDSNQMRVTMNQTLIVGLGTSFDDRNITVQVSETTSDAAHVQPGTVCFGCHQTLDPMREFFRQTYGYYYGRQQPGQLTKDLIPAMGTFTVRGSTPVTGNGIAALASAIAGHEHFPIAWAQKLCRLANSASCAEDDPEFVRVAKAFSDSHFDFPTLVREMFSSPLVTFLQPTASAAASGIVVGIQRRETLCASLSTRLGLPDVCALHGTTGLKGAAAAAARTAANLAGAVPGDGYARGAEVPLMPHDSNLFFVSGLDNLCAALATQLVDGGGKGVSKYSSAAATREAALKSFVADVMGLPASDARAAGLRGVLDEHYAGAIAAGETPTDALRSTFVLACTAPVTLSSGL